MESKDQSMQVINRHLLGVNVSYCLT